MIDSSLFENSTLKLRRKSKNEEIRMIIKAMFNVILQKKHYLCKHIAFYTLI